MISRSLYLRLAACFAVAFFVLQSFAVAHSAQYSEPGHEHNGVVCDIMVVASDDLALEPAPPSFDAPVNFVVPAVQTPFISHTYRIPQSRAPPPRGPPA